MILSKDRILTTHVGSLPRSEKVFKLVFAKEDGKNLDKKEYDEVIADAGVVFLRNLFGPWVEGVRQAIEQNKFSRKNSTSTLASCVSLFFI